MMTAGQIVTVIVLLLVGLLGVGFRHRHNAHPGDAADWGVTMISIAIAICILAIAAWQTWTATP